MYETHVEDSEEDDFEQCLDRRHHRTDWNFVELDLYALFEDFAEEGDNAENEAMLSEDSLREILHTRSSALLVPPFFWGGGAL